MSDPSLVPNASPALKCWTVRPDQVELICRGWRDWIRSMHEHFWRMGDSRDRVPAAMTAAAAQGIAAFAVECTGGRRVQLRSRAGSPAVVGHDRHSLWTALSARCARSLARSIHAIALPDVEPTIAAQALSSSLLDALVEAYGQDISPAAIVQVYRMELQEALEAKAPQLRGVI